MADSVQIENLELIKRKLTEIGTRSPRMEKDLRKIFAEVIKDARREVVQDARGMLTVDPRKSYQAVRSSVYKKIFGGQVNILSRKRNNGKLYVGGSRRAPGRDRSDRTEQLQGYYGTDRGFILRFMNAGTDDRTIKGMNNHSMKYQSRPQVKGKWKGHTYKTRQYKGDLGNRGRIEPRNWFSASSDDALVNAANNLEMLIDRAIEELWNE